MFTLQPYRTQATAVPLSPTQQRALSTLRVLAAGLKADVETDAERKKEESQAVESERGKSEQAHEENKVKERGRR